MKKKVVTNADLAKAIAKLGTKADIEKAVEVLAIGTAKGFAAMDERFSRHEGMLHTVNRRLDGLEEDVRSVKNSLSLVLSIRD